MAPNPETDRSERTSMAVNLPTAWPCPCGDLACFNRFCDAKWTEEDPSFPMFNYLPFEIREKIWKLSLDRSKRREIILSAQFHVDVVGHACTLFGGEFCGNLVVCRNHGVVPEAFTLKSVRVTRGCFLNGFGVPGGGSNHHRGSLQPYCDYTSLNAACAESRAIVQKYYPFTFKVYAKRFGAPDHYPLLSRLLRCNPETDLLVINGVPYEGFCNASEPELFIAENDNELPHIPTSPTVLNDFLHTLSLFRQVAITTTINRGSTLYGALSDSGIIFLLTYYMTSVEKIWLYPYQCLIASGFEGVHYQHPSQFDGQTHHAFKSLRWETRGFLRGYQQWQVYTRLRNNDRNAAWVPPPRPELSVGVLTMRSWHSKKPLPPPKEITDNNKWIANPSERLEADESIAAELMAHEGTDAMDGPPEDPMDLD